MNLVPRKKTGQIFTTGENEPAVIFADTAVPDAIMAELYGMGTGKSMRAAVRYAVRWGEENVGKQRSYLLK